MAGSSSSSAVVRSTTSSSSSSAAETASRLKSLLKEVSDERSDASRLDELRRLFARLIATGELRLAKTACSSLDNKSFHEYKDDTSLKGNEAIREKWNAYLKKRHSLFLKQLRDRIRLSRRKWALRTFCGVIASSPLPAGQPKRDKSRVQTIDQHLVYKLIEALCHVPAAQTSHDDAVEGRIENRHVTMDESMIRMFENDFVKPYRDAQYYTLLAIKNIAADCYVQYHDQVVAKDDIKGKKNETDDDDNEEQRTCDLSKTADNLLRILMLVDIPSSDDELKKDVATFLIPPPADEGIEPTSSQHGENQHDRDDSDDDDDDDVEYNEEDEISDGNSSLDESDGSYSETGTSKKRKRGSTDNDDANTAAAATKMNKKRHHEGMQQVRPLTVQRQTSYRRALSAAWLSLLRLPLSRSSLNRALRYIPPRVLPHMTNPLRIADFYIQSFASDNYNAATDKTKGNNGCFTSILALEGLFHLMTRHGLEYPNFYRGLYSLIRPAIFHVKHRTRFFQLLTRCLQANQMLPAYVIAAFVKRLCRCALVVSPSGALFVLALCSNLLRKHRECNCLVHRTIKKGGSSNDNNHGVKKVEEGMTDNFDEEVDDPAKARALESSLWELNALSRHYYPAVATLAQSVGTESDKTPLHDMDEFLSLTYKSLFDQERKRGDSKKRKGKVPLTFQEPKGLFVENDVFHAMLAIPMNESV